MALSDRLVWQIEMRLQDDICLDDLARRCAVSPYHLARSFRAATGMAPMTYLRARRLSVAAQALASGQDDILTIALDAQYNSHAAFTRAFAAYFGCPPADVRKARSLQNLTLMEPRKMQQDMIVDIPHHEIKDHSAFRVIGMDTGLQQMGDNSAIPPLWQRLNARAHEIAEITQQAGYGVICEGDGDGNYRYVAGFAVSAGAAIPAGMRDVKIPAGRYAVFTHKGHIADFPKTVYIVWNKALPDAGLTPREAPEFELYDQRFDIATGRGVVARWIPIE
ncbi:MAG: AraC family transcriptional regulator [Pseudomonadota bacterium]